MASLFTGMRNIWEKNWPEVHAAFTGGIPGFVFSKKAKFGKSGIPVFCYHTVTAQQFRLDLEYLAANCYVTIDADTLLAHLKGESRAPERSIVITFDDGAQNLYDIAFPLLKQFGYKAVVFIAPRFHEPVLPELQHFLKPLQWQQLQEMHNSGVFDFQSHTLEHRYVPRWPEFVELAGADYRVIQSLLQTPLDMETDFGLAKQIIEKKLGKTVRHLAFPKFFGTDEALAIGRKLGYEGFWWGALPGRPGNDFNGDSAYIVRLEAQFLHCLPGKGRISLGTVLVRRYAGSFFRYRDKLLAKRGGQEV